jgi:hypothetical protein
MEKQGLVSRIIIGILKTIWKLFLIALWGILRLTEVISSQFALWIKSIIS